MLSHYRRALSLTMLGVLCALPDALWAGEKETYGVDDRLDIYQVNDPFVRSLWRPFAH